MIDQQESPGLGNEKLVSPDGKWIMEDGVWVEDVSRRPKRIKTFMALGLAAGLAIAAGYIAIQSIDKPNPREVLASTFADSAEADRQALCTVYAIAPGYAWESYHGSEMDTGVTDMAGAAPSQADFEYAAESNCGGSDQAISSLLGMTLGSMSLEEQREFCELNRMAPDLAWASLKAALAGETVQGVALDDAVTRDQYESFVSSTC